MSTTPVTRADALRRLLAWARANGKTGVMFTLEEIEALATEIEQLARERDNWQETANRVTEPKGFPR